MHREDKFASGNFCGCCKGSIADDRPVGQGGINMNNVGTENDRFCRKPEWKQSLFYRPFGTRPLTVFAARCKMMKFASPVLDYLTDDRRDAAYIAGFIQAGGSY